MAEILHRRSPSLRASLHFGHFAPLAQGRGTSQQVFLFRLHDWSILSQNYKLLVTVSIKYIISSYFEGSLR
jgi:hypothetical protein